MILDLLLGIFLLLLAVRGWRNGFIRSLFGLVGFIVSLVLTKLFYLPFTQLLYQTALYEKITDALAAKVDFTVPDILPPKVADTLGITDALSSASANLLSILTYLVLFILIYLLIALTVRLLDRFFRLPLLNFANRFLGLIFSGLKGFLLCDLFGIILQFFRADIVAESRILTQILQIVPGLTKMLF